MFVLILAALAQSPSAAASCGAVLTAARAHLVLMDAARAEVELRNGARSGCDVGLAGAYLQGLLAARAAYTTGGDDASLAPVREAVAVAGERAALGEVAEIVGFVLRAGIAAAQSERDEMAVMLAQALQVERARGARGLTGAPLLSAHEVAGELWLQVHRYDEAAAAFRVARAFAGDSPRVTLGLARALARQQQTTAACEEYRRLAAQVRTPRAAMREALDEAADYQRQPACRPAAGRR